MACRICRSHAINEHLYDRVRGRNSDLCDVHYWKEDYAALLAKYESSQRQLNIAIAALKKISSVGAKDLKERCEHGVRWENRCGSCYPEAPALMGADHGFPLHD